MTDQQFEDCLNCLNRKRGVSDRNEICSIRGKNMLFEEKCTDYDADKSQISKTLPSKNIALKPNEQRAKIAIVLIGAMMALDLITIILDYIQYDLLQSMAGGVFVSDDTINLNDRTQQINGIIYLIVFIISAITFIQWFRRAYNNLHQRLTYLSLSEGWAAGSWFVPIISLYRPYQIMKELYEETSNLLVKNELLKTNGLSTKFLGIWWALWIINNLLGQIVFRLSNNAQTIEDYSSMTLVSMVNSFIGIPLALLAIRIIKDYSKVEPLLMQINDTKEGLSSDKVAIET